MRHFDSYRGPAMKPWLLAILSNVCNAEFARRATARRRRSGETKSCRRRRRRGRKPQLSPEAELLRQQDERNHPPARRGAAAAFREAIVLRDINNLSYREMPKSRAFRSEP